jgi:glutamate synthase (NADPH/NADH) large chain
MEHDACGLGSSPTCAGEKSRSIVEQGLDILVRLSPPRASTGADPETGDGAGILLQLPDAFFREEGNAARLRDARARCYAVGQVFLPAEPGARAACERVFTEITEREASASSAGVTSRWTASRLVGSARRSMPVLRQVYIARRASRALGRSSRKLFVIRKLVENHIRAEGLDPERRFHVPSLSSETIVTRV